MYDQKPLGGVRQGKAYPQQEGLYQEECLHEAFLQQNSLQKASYSNNAYIKVGD